MRYKLAASLLCVSSVAIASSCPTGDALLQNNTPLSSLCPNGFGQQQHGSIQDSINAQQNNTAMITAAAENDSVPTDLALAVSYHESEGFNSCAGSFSGVRGPMQLTQATAKSYGFNRDINEQNIQGGMAVLSAAYKACGYNYTCLAAHYNGSTSAQQAGWAKAVQKGDQELQANPQEVASACGGAQQCLWTGNDTPTTTTTTAATADPQIAATDTNVGIADV